MEGKFYYCTLTGVIFHEEELAGRGWELERHGIDIKDVVVAVSKDALEWGSDTFEYSLKKGHIMTTYYAHLISGDVWTEEEILAYEASDEWARECEEAHGAERTGHSDDIWDSFQELDPSFVHIDKNGIAFYDEAL